MESQSSPSEELPALYRAILDGVLELEQMGNRREAQLIRARATAAYSGSWNAHCRRRLIQLRQRIDRVLDGRDRPHDLRPRGWPLRLRLLSGDR